MLNMNIVSICALLCCRLNNVAVMVSVLWQNKIKSKKIAELERSLIQLRAGAHGDVMTHGRAQCDDAGHVVPQSDSARHGEPPGHDEYSKATQTLETAFVPCEGCYLVQQSLREAAHTIMKACETLSLTCQLARYQTTVSAVDWLSGALCLLTL